MNAKLVVHLSRKAENLVEMGNLAGVAEHELLGFVGCKPCEVAGYTPSLWIIIWCLD
jgi:hypothetical protein